MMVDRLPRGVRNNNPGNIDRTTIQWQGMADDQSGDDRFIVFTSPEWGIRAIGRILLTYSAKYGLSSVSGLINRYAPPQENDTHSYVSAVCGQLGVHPDDPVDLSDATVMTALIAAIIAVECAQYRYPEDVLAHGVRLALGLEAA